MKNKYTITTISLFCTLMLCGCDAFNSTIPDMTEEQQGMVVEYATETLLHYDRKNADKIKPKTYTVVDEEGQEVTPEELEAQIAEGEFSDDSIEATPTPEAVLEMSDEAGVSREEVSVNNEEEPSENTYSRIEDALGLSDVSIVCDGYEICDYYPEDMQSYFVMNASNGCKLVVLKLKINNPTGADKLVQIPYDNIRFKVSVNDNSRNALTTLLLNDLASFDDVVPANSAADVVVVGEFKEEDLSSINSLQLIIKGENGSSKFSLY